MTYDNRLNAKYCLTIYLMANDMVMAFDKYGEQVPELQGEKSLAIPKIVEWLEEKA